MHLLVTRPEPDASELKIRIEALGHQASVCPLIEIEAAPGSALRLDGVQALIATSRNAIRSLAGNKSLDRMRSLKLFAVGPATAAEARSAGFSDVVEGAAAARDLVPVIAGKVQAANGALLHLAGDTLAFDLKSALEREGFTVLEEVIYRSRAASSLAPAAAEAIRVGTLHGVILMSPRTASVFAELVRGAGLADAARRLRYFCLSEAVARSLDVLAPRDVSVARRPNTEEVLALLAPPAPDSP